MLNIPFLNVSDRLQSSLDLIHQFILQHFKINQGYAEYGLIPAVLKSTQSVVNFPDRSGTLRYPSPYPVHVEHPTNWINFHRVDCFLKILMKNWKPGINLYELSGQAGFASKTAFINSFKKEKGVTPGAYVRKEIRPSVISAFT